MQIPDINLHVIADPLARQMIGQLLDIIEMLHAEVAQLRAENQHLRDEVNHLESEQGKSNIKPPSPLTTPPNYSSERERRTPKPLQKGRKHGILVPTRDEPCVLDPAPCRRMPCAMASARC